MRTSSSTFRRTDTTNDTITVVDTAANLEALTTTRTGLGALGISSIAASDTLPVFSLAQMSALDTVGTTYTGQAYSGVAVLVTSHNPYPERWDERCYWARTAATG